jgi:hypothetical protein
VTGGVFGAVAGKYGRKSCTKHSFTGLTGVLMANGTVKPISEVKVGEWVLTAEPGKKKKEKHRVKAVIVTKTDRDYVDVVVATKAGPKTIQTTEHHQFYEISRNTWTQAGDLKAGQKLQNGDGNPARIVEVKSYTAQRVTYDLSIDSLHTYHVLAGATPVLVHNCNLSARASEIHAAEPDEFIRKNVSTVAVVRADTPHGPVNVVAGSGDGLTPAQMSAIGKGEIVADNIPGTHAEQNALLFINGMGWTPMAGGTSRNVCLAVCAPLIRGTDGKMMGQVYPGNGKTTTRQRSFKW